MKKIILNIGEIVKAKNALDKLLQLQGIARQKVWWLDRNRKFLEPHAKKWFTEISKEIFDQFAIDVPPEPFVPPQKYTEFKKELMDLKLTLVIKHADFDPIFAKYEVTPEIQRGIPVEKSKEYTDAIDKAAKEYQKEIEYTEVSVDTQFDRIIQHLSGEDQLAISYMLEEQSPLQVFPGNLQS